MKVIDKNTDRNSVSFWNTETFGDHYSRNEVPVWESREDGYREAIFVKEVAQSLIERFPDMVSEEQFEDQDDSETEPTEEADTAGD